MQFNTNRTGGRCANLIRSDMCLPVVICLNMHPHCRRTVFGCDRLNIFYRNFQFAVIADCYDAVGHFTFCIHIAISGVDDRVAIVLCRNARRPVVKRFRTDITVMGVHHNFTRCSCKGINALRNAFI